MKIKLSKEKFVRKKMRAWDKRTETVLSQGLIHNVLKNFPVPNGSLNNRFCPLCTMLMKRCWNGTKLLFKCVYEYHRQNNRCCFFFFLGTFSPSIFKAAYTLTCVYFLLFLSLFKFGNFLSVWKKKKQNFNRKKYFFKLVRYWTSTLVIRTGPFMCIEWSRSNIHCRP